MVNQKIVLTALIFVIGIINFSCVKEDIDLSNISDSIVWNPKFDGPVAHGDLTIDDLIESLDGNNVISKDNSNFLTLIYTNHLFSDSAKKILKIPNQTYSETMQASQYGLPLNPVDNPIVMSRNNQYDLTLDNGELIDSILFKKGTLLLQISSTFKFKGSLKITIPKLKKNKIAFETTININTSDGTFSTSPEFDLSGYQLSIDHPAATDNKVSFEYTLSLTNEGGTVNSGDKVMIQTQITDISFSSMYGYFGQLQLVGFSGLISMPLFNKFSNPDLKFKDPAIRLRTINSLGMPAEIELYDLKAQSEEDNISTTININSSNNPFLVNTPGVIGEAAKDTTTFDKDISNLEDALTIGPNSFAYSISAISNPEGSAKNFVTDSSKLDMYLDLVLPLNLSTNLLEFSETMDMNLSSIGDVSDQLKSLTILSLFENGMPFELQLQVILTDENNNSVDTLFTTADQPIVESGTIDSNGKVTASTKKEIQTLFESSRIDALKNVRHAVVKSGIITSGSGSTYVKFYSDYHLKMKFGIKTEIDVNNK